MVESILLDNLLLDGEAERRSDGDYLSKSRLEWGEHFANSGKRLPTVSEYVRFIHHTHKTNRPALAGLLQDLKRGALCTGTKGYPNNSLPLGEGYLHELVKEPTWWSTFKGEVQNSHWRTALHEILQDDVQKTVKILKQATGKRPYIVTQSMEQRHAHGEWGVWLYISKVNFYLLCYDLPYSDLRGARGVREI